MKTHRQHNTQCNDNDSLIINDIYIYIYIFHNKNIRVTDDGGFKV